MNHEIDFAFESSEYLYRKASEYRSNEGRALYDNCLILADVRDRLEYGGVKRFASMVGISTRTAENMFRIGRAEDGRELSALGITRAVLLLPFDVKTRREYMLRYDLQNLSVSELRKIIDGKDSGSAELGRAKKAGRKKSSADDAPESLPACAAWAHGALHLPLDEELTNAAVTKAFNRLSTIFRAADHAANDNHPFMSTIIRAAEILSTFVRSETSEKAAA